MSIGVLVTRYFVGFFGGFCVSLYGACIYHQHKRLGIGFIGSGWMCGAIATGYLIYGLQQ